MTFLAPLTALAGSEDAMTKPIQIRALTEQEAVALTHSTTFNALHPVRCTQCGNTQTFGRTIFWVGGVPRAEQHSTSTPGVIAHHLKERYDITSVFFKTYRNRFYADSARCKQCGSTTIEFDSELSDDLLAAVSKLVGRPLTEVRGAIEERAKNIAQNTGTGGQDRSRSRE
jgi:ribosomal protein S27E